MKMQILVVTDMRYEKRLARYLIRLRKYTNLLKPTNGNSKTLKNKGVKIKVSFLNLNYEQTLHFDEVRRASRTSLKRRKCSKVFWTDLPHGFCRLFVFFHRACSVLCYLSVTIVTLYPVRHDRYMIVKVHSYVKVVLLIPSTVLWI